MTLELQYEKRLVAFIDIIGWQDAINQNPNEIDQSVSLVIEKFNSEFSFRSGKSKDEAKQEFGEGLNPLFLGAECAVFSDNLVISKPISFEGRIFQIRDICRELLNLGFLSRGGITIGNIYHKENNLFGPALNEAVALEKEAIFPRIICSSELIDLLSAWSTPEYPDVTADRLGRHVLNLFQPPIELSAETKPLVEEMLKVSAIRTLIQDKINYFRGCAEMKKVEKWIYMQDLMELQIEASGFNKF